MPPLIFELGSKFLDLPPIFDPKDDCVHVSDLKIQYLSLQRDFEKFRNFSLLNPIQKTCENCGNFPKDNIYKNLPDCYSYQTSLPKKR